MRKKVLFLASWYPSRMRKAYGVFIKKHAEAAAKYCDVSLLYIVEDPDLKNRIFEIDFKEEDGVKTARVYIKSRGIKERARFKFMKIPRYIDFFVKYVIGGYLGYKYIAAKIGKPDIVHCNVVLFSGLIALMLRFLKGIPYIITEHWTGYLPHSGMYKGFFFKVITRTAVRYARAVIVVSENLRDTMLQHGLKNQYYVIYNVVDTQLFYPAEEKLSNNDKKKILHVSLLSKGDNYTQKNIPGILQALKMISVERQDFELHIIGDSPGRAGLEQMANDLQLMDKHVFFHGMRNVEEVAQEMRHSDFFVLFSNHENLPCVMIEAMASGLPVIATNVGGISEHIKENDSKGALIEAKDLNALQGAIIHMLDNHSSYDKQQMHNYAVDNFSYPTIGKKILHVYGRVLRQKNNIW